MSAARLRTPVSAHPALRLTPAPANFLQRACSCGGSAGPAGKCTECEKDELTGFQAKLRIGRPGDIYEREADRVAEAVVHGQASRTAHRTSHPSTAPSSYSGSAQGRPGTLRHFQNLRRSGGAPLDPATRAFMEPRFGHDFSRVRIHSGPAAGEAARSVSARAFTLGQDVVFGAGEYAPGTQAGRRLLAHELAHVIQQGQSGAARGILQRDLAIEPSGVNQAERGMSEKDIENAIEFNKNRFKDPYNLMNVRDVIGIAKYPAVSDRALAEAVARWQESHGIAQDGKLGPVTVMYVIEELQAEGNDADAALIMAEFPARTFLDVDTSFCGCKKDLQREIQSSDFFINEYTECGKDPGNRSGGAIEQCIKDRARARGDRLQTAGTTSSSGQVKVAKQKGPCGPLIERITLAHEQIHSVHTSELGQTHGRGTRAFDTAFNDPKDWVQDEVNSRNTDKSVALWAMKVLDRICP